MVICVPLIDLTAVPADLLHIDAIQTAVAVHLTFRQIIIMLSPDFLVGKAVNFPTIHLKNSLEVMDCLTVFSFRHIGFDGFTDSIAVFTSENFHRIGALVLIVDPSALAFPDPGRSPLAAVTAVLFQNHAAQVAILGKINFLCRHIYNMLAAALAFRPDPSAHCNLFAVDNDPQGFHFHRGAVHFVQHLIPAVFR